MKTIKTAVYLIMAAFVMGCHKKTDVQPTIPIPNGDFESWTGTERLQGWLSNSCPECMPPVETYIVQQDAGAYHGRYDAKFIYNNAYPAWAQNTFYIASHPVSLTAFVKSSILGADTVSIKIRLYKNTTEVDSGHWIGTTSITLFTKIVIPITQSSMQVDTAKILITGGHVNSTNLATNTILWVDYLGLQ